jgi:hypothetical protein
MSWLNAEFGRGLNLKDYAGVKLENGTYAPAAGKDLTLNVFAGRTRWHGCSNNFDHVGNQCYPKCAPGYTGVKGTCFENCPGTTSDTGNPAAPVCNQLDVISRNVTGYTTICPGGTVDKGTTCNTPRNCWDTRGCNGWGWECWGGTGCNGDNSVGNKADFKVCSSGYHLANNQCFENCPSGYQNLNDTTCFKPPYTYTKRTYSRPASVDTVP